jgi:DNA-binding MarR family transcriptional regulator
MPEPEKIDKAALVEGIRAGLSNAEMARAWGVTHSAVRHQVARLPKAALLKALRGIRTRPVVTVRRTAKATDLPGELQSQGERLEALTTYLMGDMEREHVFFAAVEKNLARVSVSSAGIAIAEPTPPPAPKDPALAPAGGQTAAVAPEPPKPAKPEKRPMPPRIPAATRVALMAQVEGKRMEWAQTLIKANEHFIKLAGFDRFIAEFHKVLSQPKYADLRRDLVAEFIQQGLFHFMTDEDRPESPRAIEASADA